ncbi:MAG: peroxiredoxin [Alphaproteobacteria bacterium]
MPGTALPPVTLPATDGSDIAAAALPGHSVIAVYPWTGRPGWPNPPDWDDIPGAHGSTPELERFRDLAPRFEALGARLFGLSRQETGCQQELVQRLSLPFPILSDADSRFAGALGLPSFLTGGATYLKRLTLFIEDGVIGRVFYPVPDPATHADEVLAWLEGQGCSRC